VPTCCSNFFGLTRLAGGLAFVLSDLNLIGIKIDTSSLRGFVILGFLFSYVGIDLILKTVAPGEKRSGD